MAGSKTVSESIERGVGQVLRGDVATAEAVREAFRSEGRASS